MYIKTKNIHDIGEWVLTVIMEEFPETQVIVGTGLSGTIGVVSASSISGIPFAVIRKENEKTHSLLKIESEMCLEDKRCVIVDDLVETGETLCRIVEILNEEDAVILGCVLYVPNAGVACVDRKIPDIDIITR